jgi:hypothetical protein
MMSAADQGRGHAGLTWHQPDAALRTERNNSAMMSLCESQESTHNYMTVTLRRATAGSG